MLYHSISYCDIVLYASGAPHAAAPRARAAPRQRQRQRARRTLDAAAPTDLY